MGNEGETVIAVVTCPECGKRFALRDTPEYPAGQQPKRFPRLDPITFLCCGEARTVPATTVEYLSTRLF